MDRVIECTGDLTRTKIEECIRRFEEYASASSNPIIIKIHSNGGDTQATLEFARLIEQSKIPTAGHATKANSGATIILIACSWRTVSPDAVIGIHMTKFRLPFVDLDSEGRIPGGAFKNLKFLHETTIEFLRKYLRMPAEEFEKITRSRKTITFTPAEAVNLGIADEIIEL